MTIDPHVLRLEPHDTIGGLLQRDADVLVERWCRRAVEEQPHAARVHHEVLRDRLPTFLRALGRTLATDDDAEIHQHQPAALEHGEQRWEAGWSLPEVIRDFQILRLVIFDYLNETLDRNLRPREVMAVGLALDDAITASVGVYVASREEALRCQATALQEADVHKNEFLATLAHELRNSLAPLLNSVEVLRLAPGDGAAVAHVQGVMERQVRQMVRLVDDLLDLSRIARGKIELRRQRLELSGVVARAVETSAPLVEAARHSLSVQLPTEPLWLEADPTRMVQVLSNLLNNAAKYTDSPGRILLTAEREGDDAVIRVRDNGRGIPAAMLKCIFDPFTQLENSGEQSQRGLGIGLALVRRLVELHGGTVAAASAGPGQGSEFTVRLPLAPDHRPPAGQAPQELPAVPARHILLIEDNADARETLQTLLGLFGHRVEVAADGAEGLARAQAVRPEVALIDIGLPGMDGYEVARKLREALGSEVFLVALTGFGQPEHRQQAEQAGYNAHLVKPVDIQELTRLLATLPERGA